MILGLFGAGRGRETIPIFPLHAVLYPGSLLPLRIFEVRYMDMAKACLRDSSPFGVCRIREGEEVGTPAAPETIGCFARIADCDAQELGILKVTAEGLGRFRILASEPNKHGLIIGEVEAIAEDEPAPEAAGLDESAEFLRKAIAAIGAARFREPLRFDDASWVAFRLAEILPLRMDVKQKLLELTDARLRLAILHKFLGQQGLL